MPAPSSTQLLLDLERPLLPTFDNFVVGRNAEALAAVRRLCAGPGPEPSARCLYLWGAPASGRSHLLAAACHRLDVPRFDGADVGADDLRGAIDGVRAGTLPLLAIDDIERTDPSAQEALFHAINAVRESPRTVLIVAGNASPRELALDAARDDLRSRLAWGLVYQLQRLDDDEKDAALAHRAHDYGFPLTPEVRRYLLTHLSRDLGALMRLVDALDRHAREHQRIVTVPLVRDFLMRTSDPASVDRSTSTPCPTIP